MVFLKKFKANGFKSFAKDIEVKFDTELTGVVGPNGSGKSNVIDAVRWVLGERSTKNLRGKNPVDIIFHGSEKIEQSKYAEVTLYFDNRNRNIKYDKDDVNVTKRLERATMESKYFINNEQCRLKDIEEMFLDTGLSKGSLGIVSQGTVQWFAEAKPEDRRKIFEDAAGIGLYTKRKIEASRDLGRIEENYIRICDHVDSTEKEFKKLEKQSTKAKLYQEKKKQLEELEVTLGVKSLGESTSIIESLNVRKSETEDVLQELEPQKDNITLELTHLRTELDEVDNEISEYQNKQIELLEKSKILEIKKAALDTNVNSDLSSQDAAKKANALKHLISEYKFEIDDATEKKANYKQELETYNEIKTDIFKRRNEILERVSFVSKKNTEAKYGLKNLENQIANQYASQRGVKIILENKVGLYGVLGCLREFIKVDQEFEKAIGIALGRAVNNIVVEDQEAAKSAINFLRNNRAGTATFLPIDTLKPRTVKYEFMLVVGKTHGFVNTADQLIDFDDKFENLFKNLLGNTIIAKDLESATRIAKLTAYIYRVISLDGDIVNAGGSMTGGYNSSNQSVVFDFETKRKQLTAEYDRTCQEQMSLNLELSKFNSKMEELTSKINEKTLLIVRQNDRITSNESLMYRHKVELEQLDVEDDSYDKTKTMTSTDVVRELAAISYERDNVNEILNVANKKKASIKNSLQDLEAKSCEILNEVDVKRAALYKITNDLNSHEITVNNVKNIILTKYNMVLEYAISNFQAPLGISDEQAKEQISQLNHELEEMGGINMEAANDLDELKERLDLLIKERDEIKTSKDQLVDAIKSLDNKARKDFDNAIKNVNATLPEIFKFLFGGGQCVIQYTNPEDILTSGIEVTANPPGKKITNLNLLSGGEKTLVALSVLFAILQNHNFPLVILDEAESALDPANVSRFAQMLKNYCNNTQFITITHRTGTMEKCDSLKGAVMATKGVTTIYSVSLSKALSLTEKEIQ